MSNHLLIISSICLPLICLFWLREEVNLEYRAGNTILHEVTWKSSWVLRYGKQNVSCGWNEYPYSLLWCSDLWPQPPGDTINFLWTFAADLFAIITCILCVMTCLLVVMNSRERWSRSAGQQGAESCTLALFVGLATCSVSPPLLSPPVQGPYYRINASQAATLREVTISKFTFCLHQINRTNQQTSPCSSTAGSSLWTICGSSARSIWFCSFMHADTCQYRHLRH